MSILEHRARACPGGGAPGRGHVRRARPAMDIAALCPLLRASAGHVRPWVQPTLGMSLPGVAPTLGMSLHGVAPTLGMSLHGVAPTLGMSRSGWPGSSG